MKVCFIDTETGGLYPSKHPIIQFAGVATDGDEIVDELDVKIQFDPKDCEPEALKLNSYSPEAWLEAVPESMAVTKIKGFFDDHKEVEKLSKRTNRTYQVAAVAGHNCRFDLEFLRAMFKRHGDERGVFLPIEFQALDTLQFAAWQRYTGKLMAKDLRLTTLCEAVGVELDGAHDALADARASFRLARALMRLEAA